jgi:hypothetical protein
MWYEAQKWEYIPTKLGTPVAKVQVAHLSVINPASTFAGVHSFEQYGDYPQKNWGKAPNPLVYHHKLPIQIAILNGGFSDTPISMWPTQRIGRWLNEHQMIQMGSNHQPTPENMVCQKWMVY